MIFQLMLISINAQKNKYNEKKGDDYSSGDRKVEFQMIKTIFSEGRNYFFRRSKLFCNFDLKI
jgi:hypothetical protein